MVKNELTEIRIEDFTREGEGIGHVDGYTLFVKDALVGDTVVARVTKANKEYGYGRVEKILIPSPDRVSAGCPVARRCGGCRLQELNYSAQLAWKQKFVRDTLRKIGGFRELQVSPVIGMDEPFRYRNKAQYPVAVVKEKDGSAHIGAGFYAGRTHSLIEAEDCLLTPEVYSEILRAFLEYMRECRVTAYDEKTGRGLVRHLLIREAFSTGEILVCPVINGTKLPESEHFVRRMKKIKNVVSICVNVNRSRSNVILGNEVASLSGEPYITDILGGLTFRISPRSFYQVNPVQTEKLYLAALGAAALTGNETVYDLYCGIGTISLFLARKAKEVYGVEIVPDAIRDAKQNAVRNGIENAHFYAGAAEELVVRGYFEPGVPCPHADVVVLDPPRKGCDASLIDAVLRMSPDRVVYVSCDPATLARDLRLFVNGGYEVKVVQPVDMFPQTTHVETVVLLSKVHTPRG